MIDPNLMSVLVGAGIAALFIAPTTLLLINTNLGRIADNSLYIKSSLDNIVSRLTILHTDMGDLSRLHRDLGELGEGLKPLKGMDAVTAKLDVIAVRTEAVAAEVKKMTPPTDGGRSSRPA